MVSTTRGLAIGTDPDTDRIAVVNATGRTRTPGSNDPGAEIDRNETSGLTWKPRASFPRAGRSPHPRETRFA